MAPNAVLNLLLPKQLKSAREATDSVIDSSGFPPKSTESFAKAINADTERLFSSPVKLIKQLVFTEFGLSPVIALPSPELSLLPFKPYTSPHLPPGSPLSLLKSESLGSHPQPNIKANNGIPKDHKQCRCKQSRCLKLYCECFAAGAYCDGCNCSCCRNNVENEALRQAAAESILERNPFAFSPKIANSPYGAQDSEEDTKDVPIVGKHNRGCRCKKTGCLKNYCECFRAKVFCSENCKCVDCKNLEGSEEKIVFHGGDNNTRKICIHQVNAAISTAIGLSGHSFSQAFRKRNFQEFLDSNDKNPPIQRLADNQKVSNFLHTGSNTSLCSLANTLGVSGPLSAFSADPIDHIVSSATQSSSKFRSRSPLADIIHSRDIEDLCSFLVLISEAAKILSDKNGTSDVQEVRENQTANIRQVKDVENQERSDVQKEVPDDHFSGNQADRVNSDNFISGGIDVKEGRHSSLRTTALMGNEKDKKFMGATKPWQIPNHGNNADVYMEQERLVLESFRDCLRKLITLGDMNGRCQSVKNPL